MTTRNLWAVALVAAVGVCGCRRAEVAGVAPEVPADTQTRLGDNVDISLADWLKLPREKLAKLADERQETVRLHRQKSRTESESVLLLPKLCPPDGAPVFRQATYSAADGVSLPPYLKPGDKDAAVALHLAHFGDGEGALKVAPRDPALYARIEAVRPTKSYPVEWTRLVGLTLEWAQLKLASGDKDGATELVVLHRQLRSVLDAKAAGGPLGAALLPVGRRALTLAAAAYRDPKANKTALADDIDAALADWGELPALSPALAPGAPAADVAGPFGVPAKGRAVSASTPTAVARALDLLALPVPGEGVEAVVAFLDAKGALAELLIAYQAKTEAAYPEPTHLAALLIDRGVAGKDAPGAPGLLRQTYSGGGLAFDVTRVTRGNAAGGFVRVRRAGGEAAPPARDLRNFGPVHLDRGFEATRLAVAPLRSNSALTLTNKAETSAVVAALGAPAPASVTVQREGAYDLVGALALRWPAGLNAAAVPRLLLPLAAAYGAPAVDGAEDGDGGSLVFRWADGRTDVRLRVPYDEKAPELLARDARGAAKGKERAEVAAAFDEAERQARLEAGKPRAPLRRSPGEVNDLPLDGLKLGQTKAEAEAALPRGKQVRRVPIADGAGALFLSAPPEGASAWARQLFVRYGPDGRVAEIRLRYLDGLNKGPTLVKALTDESGAAPQEGPGAWAGLYADLGGKPTQAVRYTWKDDRTLLSYEADAGGAEVTLRDRPADAPAGVALPPLEFVPRGVDRCALGDRREEVRARWASAPAKSGDADVFPQPASSPYESLLVWYEGGRVSRVVAVHRARPADGAGALAEAQKAWGRDVDRLGHARRQDGRRAAVLLRLFWHDDRTRVQTFAQDTGDGPRLLTEWRGWPVAEKKAAKR